MSDALTPAELFIQEELQSFSTYLVQQAKQTLVRRRIRVNDELLNSLAAEAALDELRLSFAMGGRFTDMGAGRAYHKGTYTGNRKDVSLLKGRKAKKWYSRTAYGAVYGTLVNNLSNKYIAHIADGLKTEMKP
jgi:hypothetical protein